MATIFFARVPTEQTTQSADLNVQINGKTQTKSIASHVRSDPFYWVFEPVDPGLGRFGRTPWRSRRTPCARTGSCQRRRASYAACRPGHVSCNAVWEHRTAGRQGCFRHAPVSTTRRMTRAIWRAWLSVTSDAGRLRQLLEVVLSALARRWPPSTVAGRSLRAQTRCRWRTLGRRGHWKVAQQPVGQSVGSWDLVYADLSLQILYTVWPREVLTFRWPTVP